MVYVLIFLSLIYSHSTFCAFAIPKVPIKNKTDKTLLLDLTYKRGNRKKIQMELLPKQKTIHFQLGKDGMRPYELTEIEITNPENEAKAQLNIHNLLQRLLEDSEIIFVVKLDKTQAPIIMPALNEKGRKRYEQAKPELQKKYKESGIAVPKSQQEIKEYQTQVCEKVSQAVPQIPKSVVRISSEYAVPEEEYE